MSCVDRETDFLLSHSSHRVKVDTIRFMLKRYFFFFKTTQIDLCDISLQNFSFRNPSKSPVFGNDFKKPIWYDDESDDELFDNNKVFGFQVFTNPLEIQKYHEQQMKQMLKAIEQFEGMCNSFTMHICCYMYTYRRWRMP